ncbi:carbonic anhydrase [Deinococcus irradiatisoli]|uniref:Carbonic anhydrase n=1 Tax=Deinococcus irradiatisoli TaxID=2202254 RepID=A0A2Z3JD40_9DEIO|nr:carbonic anhydrase [Deinococcus irradiatisoli]AWN22855.1 carbonic anhydrase [Deinococcus irradiatisoli]
MSAAETFQRRNAEFAQQAFEPRLSILPSLNTMILACVDPRVDPVFVLGLKPGESAVIRNVGGRLTPGALQELALLRQVAAARGARPGRFDLIVLHHTDCGITSLESQSGALAAYLGVSEDGLPGKMVGDPRAAVAVDVALLRRSPQLPPGWVVSGLVYDVATGEVEVVVPPLPGLLGAAPEARP